MPRNGDTQFGIASWYGAPYDGRPSANGEIYDMHKLTAAHRTLPFDTRVRVTNLLNDRDVDVRITDRGPFVDGRIIDLSRAAAERIDLIRPGIVRVKLQVLDVPPNAKVERGPYTVQAAIYPERSDAEQLRRNLSRRFKKTRVVRRDSPQGQWRVFVGSEESIDRAHQLLVRVRTMASAAIVVRQ